MKVFKLFVVVIVLVVSAMALKAVDQSSGLKHPHIGYELIGRAIPYANPFPFDDGEHAEILSFILNDVRGIAVDETGNSLFMAEANRSIEIYTIKEGTTQPLEDDKCPSSFCNGGNQNGLAEMGGMVYIADHGRGNIFAAPTAAPWNLTSILPDSVSGPNGVSVVPCDVPAATEDNTCVFYTDDHPWPNVPTNVGAYDVPDYTAWIGNGTEREFGGLYFCHIKNSQCEPTELAKDLPHPSAVVALAPNGPVFVSEWDHGQVRWPVFRKSTDGNWFRTNNLGSQSVQLFPSRFWGLATDDRHRYVFAASPEGLRVFSVCSGDELGVVLFAEPVTGIATHSDPRSDSVYLAVGHNLAVLTLRSDLKKSPEVGNGCGISISNSVEHSPKATQRAVDNTSNSGGLRPPELKNPQQPQTNTGPNKSRASNKEMKNHRSIGNPNSKTPEGAHPARSHCRCSCCT